MGRPKQHGVQTREALLAAAAQLVHREGRAAVSVRRVADAVGTSTRAVYTLFGDKEGLLRALSIDVAETMRRHHEAIAEQADPVAEIVELALGYRVAALEKRDLYALFIDEVRADADPNDPIFKIVYQSFDRVLHTVRRCIADDRFPGRTEWDVGRQLLAVVHGLASLELRGIYGSADEAKQLWVGLVQATLAGLGQPLHSATN